MKTILNYILSLIILLFVAIGIYSYVSRVPDLTQTGDVSAIRHFPPMICTFSTAGFKQAMRGSMHIYNGVLRGDYQYASGQTLSLHIIITQDVGAYGWEDGKFTGVHHVNSKKESGASSEILSFEDLNTASSMSCKRWWFPEASLFEVPRDIDFTEVSS